jgi:hypothetical protein
MKNNYLSSNNSNNKMVKSLLTIHLETNIMEKWSMDLEMDKELVDMQMAPIILEDG